MMIVKKNIRMGGVDFAQRMNDVMLRDNVISDEMYNDVREFLSRVRSLDFRKIQH